MFSLGILVNLRFFFIISPLQNLNILKNSSKQPLDTSKYFITNAKHPSNWVKTNLIEGYNSLKLLRILKKHPCKFLDIHSLLFKLSFSFSKLYRCFWGNWGLWHNWWRKENWTGQTTRCKESCPWFEFLILSTLEQVVWFISNYIEPYLVFENKPWLPRAN